jgi:Fur family iron response transcriptional regulator
MIETTETEPSGATTTQSSGLAHAFAGLLGESGIGDRLRAAGINLTLQRLAVGQVMLAAPVHLTADEVLSRVRGIMPEISRATVYSTLKLFRKQGLVREIIADAEHVVFDSTTSPHYHLYDVGTGKVTDVPAGEIEIVGTVRLPPDFEVEDIDVVVRVRQKDMAAAQPARGCEVSAGGSDKV